MRLFAVPYRSVISLFSTLFFLSFSSQSLASPIPWMPDMNLNQCLNEHVIANGWSEAEQVDILECRQRGIVDLTGLELLPELKTLDLAHNPLSNVSALFSIGMSQLTTLHLSHAPREISMGLASILAYQDQLLELGIAGLYSIDTSLPMGLVSLDISYSGVSDLWVLSMLSQLQHLDVSNNPIQFLEPLEMIGGLQSLSVANTDVHDWPPHRSWPNLQSLNVSNLSMTDWWGLRQAIAQMPAIRELRMAGAVVEGDWLSAIVNPIGVDVLDVSGVDKSIAEHLHSFTNLKTLSVQSMGLSSLSQIHGVFPQLESLNVANNGLEDFHLQDIVPGQGLALQELDVSGNNLHNIHIEHSVLSQLNRLNLSGNVQLDSWQLLHEILPQLMSVASLGLSGMVDDINVVNSLPNPQKLQELDLSHNRLEGSFDAHLFSQLQILNLSENQLFDVWGLENLTQLHTLNLAGNQLHTLILNPPMPSLQVLNLANNPLHFLDVMSQAASLKAINFANLQDLDPFLIAELIQASYNLEELDVSGLPFEWHWIDFPPLHQQLRVLNLANTGLDGFIWPIEQFQALQWLDLSQNNLFEVMPVFQLSQLRHVNLSQNRIEMGLMTGWELKLRHLDLSHNPLPNLQELQDFLSAQAHLQVLNLDGIALQSLPLEWVLQAKGLKELSLDAVGLENTLDVSAWPNLTKLHLPNNRLMDITGLEMLSRLVDLNVENNRLLFLPGVDLQDNLRKLNLSYNSEFDLSSMLSTPLDQLTHLSVAGLNIQDLGSLPLAQMPGLRYLDVAKNGLVQLMGVETLVNLEYLDVSNNCLQELGAGPGFMNLRELHAQNSCLAQLDYFIGGFGHRLLVLDTRDNPNLMASPLVEMHAIQSLSVSIYDEPQFSEVLLLLNQSHNLQTLRMEHAPLVSVSELPLWVLENLQELELTDGVLQDLNGLFDLPQLRSVNVNSNQIMDLQGLMGLPNLEQLSMLDNPIQHFWGLENTPHLEVLRLDGNHVLASTELPIVISAKENLQVLELHNAQIFTLWELPLMHPERLVELKLVNVQLTGVEGIDQFQNLTTLDVSNNAIHQLNAPHWLPNLTALHINSNSVEITDFSLLNFPQLENLQLNQTQFEHPLVIIQDLSQLPQLRHLGLSGWSASELAELSTPVKHQLRSLNVSSSQLSVAALEPYGDFVQLQTLNLSGNLINDAGFVSQLTEITELDLSYNKLDGLLSLQPVLPQLRYLNTAGNHQIPCEELDFVASIAPHMYFIQPEICKAGTPPDLQIVAPLQNATIVEHELILLQALAEDFEDGNLSHQILWVNSDGAFLGQGMDLHLSLPLGEHVLFASVVDLDGNRAQQEVRVSVVAQGAESYCEARGNSTAYEWIDEVVFNGMPMFSGMNGGYFFHQSMPLFLGGDFSLSLQPGFRSSMYHEHWGVWIDWNQDGQFSGDEQVVMDASSSQIDAWITRPVHAPPGETRMRVVMSWGQPAQPCGVMPWGEVEDFVIQL